MSERHAVGKTWERRRPRLHSKKMDAGECPLPGKAGKDGAAFSRIF